MLKCLNFEKTNNMNYLFFRTENKITKVIALKMFNDS